MDKKYKMIQDIDMLYHGTGATFENPDLDNSREDVDFGVGFYTTQNKEMAKKWASSKRKSNPFRYIILPATKNTHSSFLFFSL